MVVVVFKSSKLRFTNKYWGGILSFGASPSRQAKYLNREMCKDNPLNRLSKVRDRLVQLGNS